MVSWEGNLRTKLPYQLSRFACLEQKTPATFSGCWTSSLVQLQGANAVVRSAR